MVSKAFQLQDVVCLFIFSTCTKEIHEIHVLKGNLSQDLVTKRNPPNCVWPHSQLYHCSLDVTKEEAEDEIHEKPMHFSYPGGSFSPALPFLPRALLIYTSCFTKAPCWSGLVQHTKVTFPSPSPLLQSPHLRLA